MKTHRIRWRSAMTGGEWYSPPLTYHEAEMIRVRVREESQYRDAGISATIEPLPPEET